MASDLMLTQNEDYIGEFMCKYKCSILFGSEKCINVPKSNVVENSKTEDNSNYLKDQDWKEIIEISRGIW